MVQRKEKLNVRSTDLTAVIRLYLEDIASGLIAQLANDPNLKISGDSVLAGSIPANTWNHAVGSLLHMLEQNLFAVINKRPLMYPMPKKLVQLLTFLAVRKCSDRHVELTVSTVYAPGGFEYGTNAQDVAALNEFLYSKTGYAAKQGHTIWRGTDYLDESGPGAYKPATFRYARNVTPGAPIPKYDFGTHTLAANKRVIQFGNTDNIPTFYGSQGLSEMDRMCAFGIEMALPELAMPTATSAVFAPMTAILKPAFQLPTVSDRSMIAMECLLAGGPNVFLAMEGLLLPTMSPGLAEDASMAEIEALLAMTEVEMPNSMGVVLRPSVYGILAAIATSITRPHVFLTSCIVAAGGRPNGDQVTQMFKLIRWFKTHCMNIEVPNCLSESMLSHKSTYGYAEDGANSGATFTIPSSRGLAGAVSLLPDRATVIANGFSLIQTVAVGNVQVGEDNISLQLFLTSLEQLLSYQQHKSDKTRTLAYSSLVSIDLLHKPISSKWALELEAESTVNNTAPVVGPGVRDKGAGTVDYPDEFLEAYAKKIAPGNAIVGVGIAPTVAHNIFAPYLLFPPRNYRSGTPDNVPPGDFDPRLDPFQTELNAFKADIALSFRTLTDRNRGLPANSAVFYYTRMNDQSRQTAQHAVEVIRFPEMRGATAARNLLANAYHAFKEGGDMRVMIATSCVDNPNHRGGNSMNQELRKQLMAVGGWGFLKTAFNTVKNLATSELGKKIATTAGTALLGKGAEWARSKGYDGAAEMMHHVQGIIN